MSTEGDAVEVGAGQESLPRANGDTPTPSQADLETLASGLSGPGEQADGAVPFGGTDLTDSSSQTGPTEHSSPLEGDGEASEAEEPDDSGKEGAEQEDGPAFFDVLEETADEPEADLDPMLAPLEMTPMLFVEVVLMLPATHPVVVLQEADAPFRELRIPVGGAEGIAIAYAARGIATPRPLTHELFAKVLEEFTMTIDVVRITEVSGTAFSAEMVVSGPLGSRLIDCRPSDAIALALRARLPVPIMASPIVLAIAGTDPLGAN